MGIIKIDQAQERSLISKKIASLQLRYTYHRAQETQQEDELGQDYMACRYSEHEIAFCICDGVSLSYYGNLAAKLLGDALTEFLWNLGDGAYGDESALQKQLHQYLQQLTSTATVQLNNHVIPEHIGGILREVLELKKQHGSESTFVCGKVQFASSSITKLALAWAGDSRIRIWSDELEISHQLGGQFLTAERWSTSCGIVGDGPYVFTVNYKSSSNQSDQPKITKLHIYTDGLAELDTWNTAPSDVELNAMIESSLTKPTSDDITFLELEVR